MKVYSHIYYPECSHCILLYAFYGNYYVYLCVCIPIRKILCFVNVFVPMMLFYG